MTVEFNHLRGFVPASHIIDMPRNLTEDQRREEFEARIGQEMRLKVIEVDPKRRRLVMSQMLAEREYRSAMKEDLFKKIAVGDVVKGVVRSMRPFGAFVDIGGVDGLLHVSEIGFGAINHPREVLSVGQEMTVQVIRIDPESQRVALSRKRLLANPWEGIEQRYQIGVVVPGDHHADCRLRGLCPNRARRRRPDPYQRDCRHCRGRAAQDGAPRRQGAGQGAARRSETPAHRPEHPPGAGCRQPSEETQE